MIEWQLKRSPTKKCLSSKNTLHLTRSGRERAGRKVWQSQRAKHIAINVFSACHISAVACWCVPIDRPLIPLCRNLVRPYFLWAGLFQSWDMFAPVPKGANTYIEAILVYRDGSRKTWTFPKMEQLSLTEKCFKERYSEE